MGESRFMIAAYEAELADDEMLQAIALEFELRSARTPNPVRDPEIVEQLRRNLSADG